MSNNNSLSFQEKVWEEIKKIKKGDTLSYKQIAENIGLSRAYRAVGNA
jgi:O-6-methylguanine DNA methyltransferase